MRRTSRSRVTRPRPGHVASTVRPEPLEPRRLLSTVTAGATSVAADGAWQVRGTRRGDVIVVAPRAGDAATLAATVNGAEVGTHPLEGLVSLEVWGGRGNDRVTVDLGPAGGTRAVRVLGERGRDALTGGPGAETLDGGPGPDVISGGGGGDTLEGGPGNDVLTGGEGADTIRGGRGRDRVFRQGGVDTTDAAPDDRVAADDIGAMTRLDTDDELRSWVVDAAVRQYAWAFGKPATGWVYLAAPDGAVRTLAFMGAAAPGAAAPDAVSGAAGEGFSQTNVQEEGVDEADLVETDGRFIYTLRHRDAPLPPVDVGAPVTAPRDEPWQDELVIADAGAPESMSVTARVAVEGYAVGMYRTGERVAVLTTLNNFHFLRASPRFSDALGAAVIQPGDPRVKLTVFDVADRAAPALVEETYVDGSYDTSRAVGDRVYLVVRNDTWPPAPQTLDDGAGGKVYESEAAYRARLEAAPLADLLPAYTARAGGAGGTATSGAIVAAPDVYVKDVDSPKFGQNMATVAVLNVGDAAAGPSGTTSVAGWAGTSYASATSLYLASAFTEGDGEGGAPQPRTHVFQFALQADSVPLVSAGEVAGRVLNQFAMDEDGAGRLRVATTVDRFTATGNESSSGVYVLAPEGSRLNLVGSVTGLGRTERIHSVRYVGDMAHVVTFRRVDPLFVIDLSNPVRPKVAGELKVPGFSSYLHPADGELLIGLGRDADETGRVRGLQLSLFDVSNPQRPSRLAVQPIDLGGT